MIVALACFTEVSGRGLRNVLRPVCAQRLLATRHRYTAERFNPVDRTEGHVRGFFSCLRIDRCLTRSP